MRKASKLAAVLSTAALLAIGASMTSFAATGWQEENGTWVYYDRSGDRVTDTWAKSGNNWFYLNSDGEMATDELIDDGSNYFYVDSNGVMVTNAWVAVENENAGDEDEPDAYWYYFQANGKAYKSTGATSFKTINGKKYAFDSEGIMLYGWVKKEDSSRLTGDDAWQDGDYYCGDENDGARAEGWLKLDVVNDDEDKSYWFYFNPANGKKHAADDATAYAIKTINGKKYAFNEYGAMQDGWTDTLATDGDVATITEYQYFNGGDEGWRLQKGWVKVVPAEAVNAEEHDNEDNHWYYADGSGKIYSSALKTINSKKYAFNKEGVMQSGLVALKMNGNDILDIFKIDDADKIETVKDSKYDGYDIYYFGGGEDGSAKTGNQTIDIDGENYTYTFGNAGTKKYKGEQTVSVTEKTKTIYVRGQKVKAEKDYKYEGVDLKGNKFHDKGAMGKFLVNTSGSLMKGKGNVKDADGFVYKTNKTGVVVGVKNQDGDVIAGSFD